MKRILLIGAALAIAGATPANAQNLVTNGSFESGLANWTLGGAIAANGATGAGQSDPVVFQYGSTANYPNGAFGEAIPVDNATSASPDAVGRNVLYLSQDFGTQTLTQNIVLAANTLYSLGFDYYVPQNGYNNPFDATLGLSIGGNSVASLTTGSPSSNTPPVTWRNFNQTFNSGAGGAATLTFSYGANGYTAADFAVDRVFLQSAVPEPATWAMMIVGFGLMGGALRRRTTVRFANA